MKVHCKFDELVEIEKLRPHPKNPNRHTPEQIERLSELYQYHGIRHPIIVSKLSGYIVAGHGRLEAAKWCGIEKFPVVYQDFENSEAEYAFVVADNAVAAWAELDLSMINIEVPELGPDFNIDMLGIKDFTIDPIERVSDDPIEITGDETNTTNKTVCPKCGHKW